MRRFVSRNPFLVLAAFTIVVGAVWHLSGIQGTESTAASALRRVVLVLGMPFIFFTRELGRVIEQPGVRGLASLVCGLLPYLAADWLFRRWRASTRTPLDHAA